ncbi:MAG: CinA family protein [Alphaproteobacteria bacterium]|nr:MAG: CinA family protein [Alphaproteobacteria bacterium]
MIFSDDLILSAIGVLDAARDLKLKVTTAESCTGGLIAGLLTEIPGSSEVVERGFVTYSNEAKTEMLGVDSNTLETNGAVSGVVAQAMAEGALDRSRADVSVAVTGVAGPGGGTDDKPVGLVWIASARRNRDTLVQEHRFGELPREDIRLLTIEAALKLLMHQIED